MFQRSFERRILIFQTNSPPENGAVILFFALVIPVLIGLLALVIDYGLWMQTRSSLKSSADAASLRGVQALRNGKTQQEITYIGQEMLRANLRADGYSEPFIDSILAGAQVQVDGVSGTVQVAGNMPSEAIFSRFFNVTSLSVAVESRAAVELAAGRRPLDLVLVLDHSGSMVANLTPGVSRMDALKAGLVDMIQHSQNATATLPFKDRIQLIPYSGGCPLNDPNEVMSPIFTIIDENSDLQYLGQGMQSAINWVNSLTALGSTATACGLAAAYGRTANFVSQGGNLNRTYAVILATDGFPNVNYTDPSGVCCSHSYGAGVCWADRIRGEFGVPVFAIGIGSFGAEDSLERIAGEDSFPSPPGCILEPGMGPLTHPSGKFFTTFSYQQISQILQDSLDEFTLVATPRRLVRSTNGE